MGDKDNPYSATRRSFVAGTGLVASTGLGILNFSDLQVRSSRTPTKRMPQYRSDGEVSQWKEVPKAWYSHLENARRAKAKFNDQFLNQYGILETGLIRSEESTYGGKNGFKIEPVISPNSKVNIPESIRGIQIEVNIKEPPLVTPDIHGCVNVGNFDPCPGGVNTFDTSYSDLPCTTGYPVSDTYGVIHLVTAAHCFGYNCSITDGDDVYQEDDNFGTIRGDASDSQADVAVVIPDGDSSAKSAIREPDDTVRDVDGSATKDNICDRASRLFDGHSKVGVTTEKTTGGIGKCEITRDDCPSLKGEGFRCSHDAAGGDSGGPHYSIQSDGEAFVLGHHWGSDNKKDETEDCHGSRKVKDISYAMPAYWLENNTQFYVPSYY